MRILIYSYNYYPEPIGIAPLMTELAEGLVSRGHQVRVVTAMPNYPERKIYPGYEGKLYKNEYRNGVKIERCFVAIRPKPGLLCRALLESSFSVLSVVKAISGWRPDVILSTVPSLTACLPVAVAKTFHRCPSVLSLQDILPEAAVQTGLLTNSLAIKVFEQLEKFAYTSATKIGVISSSFTQNLLEKAVPPHKIECISNWVDTGFIAPMRKEDNAFRRAYGLCGKFVVLYSGNIARTQGVRTIIRAAAQMQSTPDIQFVVVGEKSQLNELDQLRVELGVENLLLLPFVSREDLPEMLAAADVSLVMQKRNVVGFNMPSKIQVIMASGRPIIASVPAHSAAAEAIAQSQGGLVTYPECPTALADAIQTLYEDPRAVAAFGQRARQFAIENYSFDQALNAYETLLRGVVIDRANDVRLRPAAVAIASGFTQSDLNR